MNPKASIVSVITTPLGFFALSLLIVESFLATILLASNGEQVVRLVGIAATAFFTVVIIVTLLVWHKPLNLTLRGEDWNERDKNSKDWGSSDNPKTKNEVENLPVQPPAIIKKKVKAS